MNPPFSIIHWHFLLAVARGVAPPSCHGCSHTGAHLMFALFKCDFTNKVKGGVSVRGDALD